MVLKLRRLLPLAVLLTLCAGAAVSVRPEAPEPLPPAHEAWVTIAIQLAVAAAALLLARLLLKPKNRPKNQNEDETPTTLSGRGMRLPYPIGRQLIGYGFGWAGDDQAEAIEEPVEGSGGGKGSVVGGSPPAPTQTIWYMPAWHQLCPGIVTKLISIEDNGQITWQPDVPLTPANTPSGSTVDAGDLGTFEIYWGEDDQPVSEFLSDSIGVRSRWPGMCYIVWTRARLGGSRAWPQRKYLVEKMYSCITGLECPYVLDDGTSRGVNPAWVMFGFFSGETPDGCNLDLDQVDIGFLNDLCALCVAEHLPMNLTIDDGQTLEEVIKGMLADLGVTLVDDRGVLTGRILRQPEGGVPNIGDDVLTAPDLESTIQHNPEVTQLATYLFKDHLLRYKDNDISYQQDYAEGVDTPNPSQVPLTIPTDYATAEKIAARRIQELTGDRSTHKFNLMRNATRLLPGDPFLHEGQPYRIASIQRSATSSVAVADAFLDSYTFDPVISGQDDIPDGGVLSDPEEDQAVAWFELPASVSGTGVFALSVLRLRAHSGVSGSNIWISADAGSYSYIGQQNAACAGGELLSALGLSGAEGEDVVATGPTFESWTPSDISTIRDLTGDIAAWQAVAQIAVINDELFYLKKKTAVSSSAWAASTIYTAGNRRLPTVANGFSYVATVGGTSGSTQPVWPTERLATVVDGTVTWQCRGLVYELNDLIRARQGTVKATHAIGDVVFIGQSSSLNALTSPLLQPGVDVCLKSQPFVGRRVVDLTAITSLCELFVGDAAGEQFIVTHDTDFLVTHTGDRIIAG